MHDATKTIQEYKHGTKILTYTLSIVREQKIMKTPSKKTKQEPQTDMIKRSKQYISILYGFMQFYITIIMFFSRISNNNK